ncbi:MAG: hypothetical protein LBF22_13925 [Deltaproteobacteria bacterium]|jgi:hypothetical protein|nr:hypothetical protein [Deltaproteobacteria bacterium]
MFLKNTFILSALLYFFFSSIPIFAQNDSQTKVAVPITQENINFILEFSEVITNENSTSVQKNDGFSKLLQKYNIKEASVSNLLLRTIVGCAFVNNSSNHPFPLKIKQIVVFYEDVLIYKPTDPELKIIEENSTKLFPALEKLNNQYKIF